MIDDCQSSRFDSSLPQATAPNVSASEAGTFESGNVSGVAHTHLPRNLSKERDSNYFEIGIEIKHILRK